MEMSSTQSLRFRGKDIEAGLGPFGQPYWFWRCSRKDSKNFWAAVAKHDCIVIEMLNPAVRGLLFCPDASVSVVYDVATANKIWDNAWVVSNPQRERMISEKQENMLNAWTLNDLGPGSPAWIVA